jgi:hypothetical protein
MEAKLIKAKSSQNFNCLCRKSTICMVAVNPLANMRTPQGSINNATHSYLADQVATFPDNK